VEGTSERRGWRGWGAKAAFAAGGLLVGGLVGSLTASPADTGAAAQTGGYGTAVPNGAYGGPRHGGGDDESRSQRPDEHLLSGDTATKVRQAALARYPGAAALMASDNPSSLQVPTGLGKPTKQPSSDRSSV
jgi:hypothetical protein